MDKKRHLPIEFFMNKEVIFRIDSNSYCKGKITGAVVNYDESLKESYSISFKVKEYDHYSMFETTHYTDGQTLDFKDFKYSPEEYKKQYLWLLANSKWAKSEIERITARWTRSKKEVSLNTNPCNLANQQKGIYEKLFRHQLYQNSIYVIPYNCPYSKRNENVRQIVELSFNDYALKVQGNKFFIVNKNWQTRYMKCLKSTSLNKKFFLSKEDAQRAIDYEERMKKLKKED